MFEKLGNSDAGCLVPEICLKISAARVQIQDQTMPPLRQTHCQSCRANRTTHTGFKTCEHNQLAGCDSSVCLAVEMGAGRIDSGPHGCQFLQTASQFRTLSLEITKKMRQDGHTYAEAGQSTGFESQPGFPPDSGTGLSVTKKSSITAHAVSLFRKCRRGTSIGSPPT